MFRSSATNNGSSTTPSVSVPANVQIGDWVGLAVTIDNSTADFEVADIPAGFIELADDQITGDGQRLWIGVKRLVAVDVGTYAFGAVAPSGTPDWIAHALAFSGRHPLSVPTISAAAIDNGVNTTPVTITANAVTAQLADDLWLISAPDVRALNAGNLHTPPADFLERLDNELSWANLMSATKDNVLAGSTGAVSSVFALSSSSAAWATRLVRLPAAVVPGVILQRDRSHRPAMFKPGAAR